jgi:molecular chaperone Hsp33
MSELQKFIFDGLPVRGVAVRLTDAWQEILRRRQAAGGYPPSVCELLGEMAAASLLMQGNIKFNGAVVFQMMGEGPVKMAVAEASSDLGFRCTAKVMGQVNEGAALPDLLNTRGMGRCAITLDPKDKLPGQQPYQGVVPLVDEKGRSLESLSQVLEHYMRQSEQLETQIILAANDQVAAGLLIQRLPTQGGANLAGKATELSVAEREEVDEAFNRITILAGSLKREELLTLDIATILYRLFWEETVSVYEPQTPRFACTCSRERVRGMLQSLGQDEVQSILSERPDVEVGCDFCGAQYRFDPIDAAQVFMPAQPPAPAPDRLQ